MSEKEYQDWLAEQFHAMTMLQRDADNMVGDVFEDYPADDDETLADYQPRPQIKTRTVSFRKNEE